MSNPIKFYIGDESRLVVDSYNNRKDSIFSEQYDKAFDEINRTLLMITKNSRSSQEDDSRSLLVEKSVNNIFAFVGDRGTGKSSCMMSVANMLEERRKDSAVDEKDNKGFLKCQKGFAFVETIDPSFFDDDANILEIVIGKLFGNFKNIAEHRYSANQESTEFYKNSLYSDFQKVKSCLNHISKHIVSEDDGIEKLLDLSDSVELQKNMQKLVDDYLLYMGKDVLVLSIDDIDLNTVCAYTMVEQMRKYFVLNNVILLIAMKIEQLDVVIRQKYYENYKQLVDKKVVSDDVIADMASKYLTKLLPQSHRIYMPDISVMSDRVLEIYNQTNSDCGIVRYGKYWKLDEYYKKSTVKYVVTSLIFRKTRFLFYHANGMMSPIVPTNLRDLRHLIGLLYEMEDWNKENPNEYNKLLFKQYFFNTWAESNLYKLDVDFIHELLAIKDVSILNKTVVNKLDDTFRNFIENLSGDDKLEIDKIKGLDNSPYNISIGDVFAFIITIKRMVTDRGDKMFLFALETFYSMRLYEYYDLRTESRFITEKKNLDKNIDYTIKKSSILDGLSSYDILTGGCFINSKTKKVIADKNMVVAGKNKVGTVNRIERIRRDIRIINLKTLIKKTKYDDDIVIQIVELFSLLISRKNYNTGKAGVSDSKYRCQKEPVYTKEFDKNQMNVWFDINSFLYNITDIKRAYDRISPDLYVKAENMEKSILNQLRKMTAIRDGIKIDNKEQLNNRFLSWCSIRNSEVLEELTSFLENPDSKGDDVEDIKYYFDRLSRFKIKTYDRDEDGNPYDIDFSFANVFRDVLGKDNDCGRELFNKIFNNIEDDTDEVEPTKPFNNLNIRGIDIELFKKGLIDPKLISSKCRINGLGKYRSSDIKKTIKRYYKQFEKSDNEFILNDVFKPNRSYNVQELLGRLKGLNDRLK